MAVKATVILAAASILVRFPSAKTRAERGRSVPKPIPLVKVRVIWLGELITAEFELMPPRVAVSTVESVGKF